MNARLTLLLVLAGRLMAHDWLIVPGKRAGPVTATSTEADLKDAFGAAAVKRAQIRIDNKTSAAGLEIYTGKPGQSLAVVWPRNDGGMRWPLLVIPCYAQKAVDCRWQTAEGVRVGMSIGDLEKLNEKPLLLYPDTNSMVWREVWWSEGKLAGRLGEDVEIQFEIRPGEERPDQGYFASNEAPLKGSGLLIRSMFVYLLSAQKRVREMDWTIGGRSWPAIVSRQTELLRESFGPDQVHRTVGQGEEGIGQYPGVSLFEGQNDRSVLFTDSSAVICGGPEGYGNCRWHLPKPFALTMTLKQVQELNGGHFLFNGFDWDYGGVIVSWDGGKLEKQWPGAKAHYVSCKGDHPDRMVGEGHSLRSDDPDLQKLDCSVLYR